MSESVENLKKSSSKDRIIGDSEYNNNNKSMRKVLSHWEKLNQLNIKL